MQDMESYHHNVTDINHSVESFSPFDDIRHFPAIDNPQSMWPRNHSQTTIGRISSIKVDSECHHAFSTSSGGGTW
jgi:hypothetical protein